MAKHHIIPKHEWKARFGNLKGINTSDNLVNLTTEQHAQVHEHYYTEITHLEGDRIASLFISRLIGKEEAIRQTIVASNKARKGEKRSPEWCAFISAFHKGRVKTPEHCKNISLSKIGIKHTEEWKQKISKIMTGKKRGPYRSAK